MDFHPIDFCEFCLWTRTELKTEFGNVGVKTAKKILFWLSMRWEKSLRCFGVAKRKPLENTNEAGEKFEMIWCGKEKAIGEYKVKACDVDECFV